MSFLGTFRSNKSKAKVLHHGSERGGKDPCECSARVVGDVDNMDLWTESFRDSTLVTSSTRCGRALLNFFLFVFSNLEAFIYKIR